MGFFCNQLTEVYFELLPVFFKKQWCEEEIIETVSRAIWVNKKWKMKQQQPLCNLFLLNTEHDFNLTKMRLNYSKT